MKNIITQFSRIFVGSLFIISGLIKLNDPVGFSYKLAEYFSEPVLNLPFLVPLALAIAVTIVIFETMLGVMLLLDYKSNFTIFSLLAMIVFFTFLTFYSAYFNKVTDCGCFGDALKLTPWQSFTKDIVLLFFIIILFINRRLVRPLFGKSMNQILIGISLALCVLMAYWVLNHLPLVDFRAYKVQTNIQKAMEIPDDAPKAKVDMVFVYNVGGVDKDFSEADVMAGKIPDGAKFVKRNDVVITPGYIPEVHDFTMEKDGGDHKAELMEEPKLMAFIAYDLSHASPNGMAKLEKISKEARSKGYKVIALTASNDSEIDDAKKLYDLTFDFYFCDGTTLKTIERANPSIVIFNRGTIVQKLHFNDADQIKY